MPRAAAGPLGWRGRSRAPQTPPPAGRSSNRGPTPPPAPFCEPTKRRWAGSEAARRGGRGGRSCDKVMRGLPMHPCCITPCILAACCGWLPCNLGRRQPQSRISWQNCSARAPPPALVAAPPATDVFSGRLPLSEGGWTAVWACAVARGAPAVLQSERSHGRRDKICDKMVQRLHAVSCRLAPAAAALVTSFVLPFSWERSHSGEYTLQLCPCLACYVSRRANALCGLCPPPKGHTGRASRMTWAAARDGGSAACSASFPLVGESKRRSEAVHARLRVVNVNPIRTVAGPLHSQRTRAVPITNLVSGPGGAIARL
jgi:hypothetical protein